MKKKLMVIGLLAAASMFAQSRFSVGVSIGGNRGYYTQAPVYAPYGPSYAAVVPPCPGPDYTWVDGSWSQYGGRRSWVAGYWNRRPYNGYENRRFDERYERGFYRDHDRDRDDRRRDRDRDDGRFNSYSYGYRR